MNNKKKILKIIFTILSVALFVGLIIYLFPTMKGITTPEGRLKFQQKLDGMGMGKFCIIFTYSFRLLRRLDDSEIIVTIPHTNNPIIIDRTSIKISKLLVFLLKWNLFIQNLIIGSISKYNTKAIKNGI